MTYEKLADAKTIVEIDDVHNAHCVLNETCGMKKELRIFRIAQLLATLREHYVQIGRELGPEICR